VLAEDLEHAIERRAPCLLAFKSARFHYLCNVHWKFCQGRERKW
jgi:hypothetical protein